MITVLSSRHAADVFRHLRRAHGWSRTQLARHVHVDPRTVAGREHHEQGYHADALIDTAAAFGFAVTLLPTRRPGRPTGTGWPA